MVLKLQVWFDLICVNIVNKLSIILILLVLYYINLLTCGNTFMFEKIKDNQKGFNFISLKKRVLLMSHPVY